MEYLSRLLRDTSRTFALSIEGLPEALREEMTVAYLLFRVSDYLEDHAEISAEEKITLLRQWDEVLGDTTSIDAFIRSLQAIPHEDDDPEAMVALESGSLLMNLRRFPPPTHDTIIRRVRETTRGMATWQTKGARVDNEDELDDYMHHVAGIVGYLVTELFAAHSRFISRRLDTLMPLAREFGLALQTVNVIRGLRKDYLRGWIFVPKSYCSARGLTPDELFSPERVDSALAVIDDLAAKGERHLLSGLAYVRSLPRHMHRLRLACMWPMLFAAKTLAISRNNPAIFTGEAKIGRETVKHIMRMSSLYGWSNVWLKGYTMKLLHAPHA
ncbi:MAG: squalene/phytoene synthase family protein [Spirochaetota bacterium]